MKKWLLTLLVFMFASLLFAGAAMADGTLTATFLYNGSGVNQPLAGAYMYLHAYPTDSPIMAKFFRNAQYILGPSDSNGNFSVSVPEGAYRVRIIRRAPLGSTPGKTYGPPNTGDYTWHATGAPIGITTGSVVNLGTLYATVFGGSSASITVTGIVYDSSWAPAAGWFVFASQTLCMPPGYWGTPNCMMVNGTQATRYPAQAPTDANGHYVLHLSKPGTYYIYGMPYPRANAVGVSDPYSTCRVAKAWNNVVYPDFNTCFNSRGSGPCYADCPITINAGDQLTNVNIVPN